MASKIVALVRGTNIMIMLRGPVTQTTNAPQFVNGVIGVNGVLAIPIVSKVYGYSDEQIMKIQKELVEFRLIYGL